MLSTSRLSIFNELECTKNGVFTPHGQTTAFGYSDGNDQEARLKAILTGASDLSSLSPDLELAINNWPTEYHLSPQRANLLRYLDLTRCNTVLELGSGCGALTRFLGEQGLTVDAVEGSEARANLTRMRCRDLSNVDVIISNFYNLDLPPSYYDVVFLIGVVEYAGRFAPSRCSAEQAVIQLLESAKASISPQGSIVIAIENRFGRKYLAGAAEDHYGIAFEGILGYPNYSGIKTWSKPEWKKFFNQLDLETCFHYPFPDYKIPSLILNESYLRSDINAWTKLAGIQSRDYHKLIPLSDDLQFWKYSQKQGCLDQFANSFLIVAGSNRNNLEKIAPFDFIHTSAISRRNEFRTQTRRRKGANTIEKVCIQEPNNQQDGLVSHIASSEPWREGIPLSVDWIERLQDDPSHDLLIKLTQNYYSYLTSKFASQKEVFDLFDVLPTNIMVTTTGRWNSFDHEWKTTLPITPEYVFFRGLFYFAQAGERLLQSIYRTRPNWTLEDAIDACFSASGLNFRKHKETFLAWEEEIQEEVLKNRKGVTTSDFLQLRLSVPKQAVQIFWASPDQSYSETRSLIKHISIGGAFQQLSFALPLKHSLPLHLRIDPGSHAGIFCIREIRVLSNGNQTGSCLQRLRPGRQEDSDLIDFHDVVPYKQHHEHFLRSISDDPFLSWVAKTESVNHTLRSLVVEVSMIWIGDELDIGRLRTHSSDWDRPGKMIDATFRKLSLFLNTLFKR